MLYKRPDSTLWQIKFKYSGTVYRRSAKTKNIEIARQREQVFRDEVKGFFVPPIYSSTNDSVVVSREWGAECRNALSHGRGWLAKALYSANKKNRDRFGLPELTKKQILDIALPTGSAPLPRCHSYLRGHPEQG